MNRVSLIKEDLVLHNKSYINFRSDIKIINSKYLKTYTSTLFSALYSFSKCKFIKQ